MDKNIRTFFFTVLTCLLLLIGFEASGGDIGGVRLRFGSSYFSDSTNYITSNRSLLVNGTLKASDSIDAAGLLRADDIELDGTSGTITFEGYGSFIEEGIDALTYNATTHYFRTKTGNDIFSADSATGVTFSRPVIHSNNNLSSGFSTFGSGSTGPRLKLKVLRGVIPAVSNTLTIAHGLTVTDVVMMNYSYYNDSLQRFCPAGYNLSAGTALAESNGYLTTTNFSFFVPAAAVNIPGDTMFVSIWYEG